MNTLEPYQPKTTNHKTTLKHSKQPHYILTDNILLSVIEKIETSYHTQSNFLPKQAQIPSTEVMLALKRF
jgi:hypothetical protein